MFFPNKDSFDYMTVQYESQPLFWLWSLSALTTSEWREVFLTFCSLLGRRVDDRRVDLRVAGVRDDVSANEDLTLLAELSLASDLRLDGLLLNDLVNDFGVDFFLADFDSDLGVFFLSDFLALLALPVDLLPDFFTRGVTVREAGFRVGVRDRDRDLDFGRLLVSTDGSKSLVFLGVLFTSLEVEPLSSVLSESISRLEAIEDIQ